MSIYAENLDSLRLLIRNLYKENKYLKELLDSTGKDYPHNNVFLEKVNDYQEYDPDQGARIISRHITEDDARKFYSFFRGRPDVYAKRGKNGGYFPQCSHRWNSAICPKFNDKKSRCEKCDSKSWIPINARAVISHLTGSKDDGSDVIGIYPLFSDGTCRFIVFDFDNHSRNDTSNLNNNSEWQKEVDALREICEINGITPLVERSRSGNGAHLWILFSEPVKASVARNFGFLLLDKGQEYINFKTFKYYDRMYPSQATADEIGNLIAAPLQGKALKSGNSAFVDSNWNAFPDQWNVFLNKTNRLSAWDVDDYIAKWKSEVDQSSNPNLLSDKDRPRPWKKNQSFIKADVIGKMHIVYSDGVYVDALNLMPRIQNQIRSLAAFDNPIYYKNKRLGYSNYNNFSSVYMGRDEDGYICIPIGLKEKLISKIVDAGIEYDEEERREKGRPIRVSFNGDLRVSQTLAADRMLAYDSGILSATTAFGKTVVCSYLISRRRVSTLIVLQSKDLLNQWVEELNRFLTVDEVPPEYTTKSGRIKRRDNVIGILTGNKNSLTGIIDVAMVGSLQGKENLSEILNSYGMVIMDECHHCGSNTSISVMSKVKSRYVYGVTATPKRSDNLEQIIYMLLGPIRHSYTAKDRALVQGIEHLVYPRFTRVVALDDIDGNINAAYNLVCSNNARNNMIVEDVRTALADGRTPVILTRFKDQAKVLYDNLLGSADSVILLYGDNSDKENAELRSKLKRIPANESIVLIATGQKIGEGFDYPRLDTLFLATPVSSATVLEQYVGRLNRDYLGKENVIVYDYIDARIKVFNNMYSKRLRTYKKLGYNIISSSTKHNNYENAIYNSENYNDVFERDLIDAEKSIVIASPFITRDKIERFIVVTKSRIDVGCNVHIITLNPDRSYEGDFGYYAEMFNLLKSAGIEVSIKDDVNECFAIIDNSIVWHGGMNLLGKEDVWDNLIRIKDSDVAAELLELSFGNN